MPQKPLPLITSLKHWREENGFSQSDAVKVLNNPVFLLPWILCKIGSPASVAPALMLFWP
jgi:hypothetical protein